MKKKLILILGIYTLCLSAQLADAQVSIAPTTLYTDPNGISTFYITNPSSTPQEVTVSFVFGYPDYNDLGELRMIYEDPEKDLQWGLGTRLRVFPRSFILGAKKQQVVRLQVMPDPTKPDGMYFSRVKITSNIQASDIDAIEEEGVAMRVNFKFDQILAVFHKQGTVNTSLKLGKTTYSKEGDKLHVISEFQRGGNAPFIGTAHLILRDPQNQIVAEQRQTTALYFDALHKVTLELPTDLILGDYDLEVNYRTERNDINPNDLVKSEPIRRIIRVKLTN